MNKIELDDIEPVENETPAMTVSRWANSKIFKCRNPACALTSALTSSFSTRSVSFYDVPQKPIKVTYLENGQNVTEEVPFIAQVTSDISDSNNLCSLKSSVIKSNLLMNGESGTASTHNTFHSLISKFQDIIAKIYKSSSKFLLHDQASLLSTNPFITDIPPQTYTFEHTASSREGQYKSYGDCIYRV